MCGLFAIVSKTPLDSSVIIDPKLLKHRGPDSFGEYRTYDNLAYLAHWRLSIIDTKEASNQPLHSSDKRFTTIFNGEIYNYLALRKVCINKGSIFKTKGDTEVIMEIIRHFGVKNGIAKMRGMFAFVILDKKNNEVIIARDHLGIKPLYYGIKDDKLYIASEIKALLKISPFYCEVDKVTEEIFLHYGHLDRGEWTFYKNIKRFPQAHFAVIKATKIPMSMGFIPYWTPPKEIQNIPYRKAIEKLKKLMIQSIKRHLVSDVPIAFALSGGIDSSILVGLARKLNPLLSINTFTTRYPDYPEIDETKWAQFIINKFNATAHFITPTDTNFLKDFSLVTLGHDEPYGSTSTFAQYYIFKAIREGGFKVSIDGQGADEIFGGYHGILALNIYYLIKQKKLIKALGEVFYLIYKYPRYIYTFSTLLCRKIKKDKKTKSLSKEARTRIKSLKDFGSLEEYLVDLTINSNLPQLLRNADRNSMLNSVESRVPFLDIDLVEFVLTLPIEFRVNKARTKFILRDCFKDILPKEVLNRKDKKGFPTPEQKWLLKLGIKVRGTFSIQWRKYICKAWKELCLKKF